ncbi:MAG: HlyC/CorC family transporter [Chloroflexi bacterium]|nr:HlyC/CorC family transporter [Chloroflexota bacterium]
MNVDRPIEVAGIVAAVVLLLVVTSAEAILIYLSRGRARVLAGRGARGESLHRYIEERSGLLSTVHFGRNLAIILGTVSATHLAVDAYGSGWETMALTGLVVLVVIGVTEGIPEMLGARNPEHWGLILSPLIRILGLVFWLPSRLLDLPGVMLARLTPLPTTEPEEDEHQELLRLVELEESNGGIEREERQMIRGVIKLVDTAAREIMAPRIDIAAVPSNAEMADVQRIVVERGYSRIPMYEDTIDNIIGVVYAKDVLKHLSDGTQPPSLKELARPPYFIPETKKVDELLTELRQNKIHIAIVVDEYGGTAGLVTTEDILEEIVGEIEDEYDVEEAPIERLSDVEAILDARVGIDALNELFDLELENEDYDTVGGILFTELGRVPAAGDEVQVDGISLHVLSVIGRRIKKVRVTKLQPAASEP